MTETNFRELCAELFEKVEDVYIGSSCLTELRNRARAALAQPEPQADGEVAELVAWLRDRANSTSLAHAARRITRAADLLERLAQPELQGPTVIGPEWQPCVKLPITVHVREQRPGETHNSTREGITPLRPDDLIMRGVQGEEYPIGRELFNQTYRMGAALAQPEPQGPTDEELDELFIDIDQGGEALNWRPYARAVLARWGRPAIEPVPTPELGVADHIT